MKTIRLTMAQALVRYLIAQRTVIDGEEAALFAGVFAIFGHGNGTCLGEALKDSQDALPTWRGQNEQSMALTAIAYAKAKRRRQIMVTTSSIGPGATNMVTAAGVAHANRLPVLLLAGDTFAGRAPDPVLQQVEHFGDATITVNDAFKAVARYWDRITRPEQIIESLPQAVATMLDPGDCGPAFLGLSQDAQGEAFDYPQAFFEPTVHRVRRPRPDEAELAAAAELVRRAEAPLIIAGGGVHYSLAESELAAFAERHDVPVAETIAGRASLAWDHRLNAGPIGAIGSTSANALAVDADLLLTVGTRLQDITTGSWTAFQNPALRIVALNAARFDAAKHRARSLVCDAREGLVELGAALGDWRAPAAWAERAARAYGEWNALVDEVSGPSNATLPSYAHVIGAVNRRAEPSDIVVTAAGGLPGELNKVWRNRLVGAFDCEFAYSCMGYEVAGGWGQKMAAPDKEVIVFVGDGSYLMMNSDIYSTVLTGHKLIVIVCDNGGFAVVDRVIKLKSGVSFNNLLADCRAENATRVDFAKHAESMGAIAETVDSIAELEQAFERAKAAAGSYVIVVRVDPVQWTPGDTWWDLGAPEVSSREEVRRARAENDAARRKQRVGV